MNPYFRVSSEVADAVAQGRPVVALESTILTHGFPRPRNLRIGVDSERLLRDAGVVPATVGVVDGTLVVGLSTAEIERLSNEDGVVKASIRDLPVAAAKGLNAGTTVAATAYAAHRAGIRVFSTGGLGGVHQGAAETFDESADLGSLAALPLVVVSAGVKSILDIGLTLERLETLNLPVVGYRTTRYPGFYTTESGFEIEYAADSPEEIAAIARGRDAFELRSAVLVANPVPVEQQLDPAVVERVLAEANAAAEERGIAGHDTTPFLLSYIFEATGGASLDVNVSIYLGNVALGGAVAVALASPDPRGSR